MLWNFLLYSVPWYAWLALAAVVAAALFLLAVRVFGWERVKPWVLPVFIAVGAGALLSRSRQQGWKDKVAADIKAADKLIEKAKKARTAAEREQREHPEKLRDDDGFRRD